jgi:[ribosomal protein S5]-alanine N-acetyltransferase
MAEQATLTTERLVIRPLQQRDAPEIHALVGAYEVALNTLSIPHPYPEGAAEVWIAGHRQAHEAGQETTWGITAREGGSLLGVVSLRTVQEHRRAEMGYWIGVPYWNRGYMTEAARAVVSYGFEDLGLHRIYATHVARNPASGRVMQKAGMRYEGCLRQHVWRWDVPQDLLYYGILRTEWEAARKGEL